MTANLTMRSRCSRATPRPMRNARYPVITRPRSTHRNRAYRPFHRSRRISGWSPGDVGLVQLIRLVFVHRARRRIGVVVVIRRVAFEGVTLLFADPVLHRVIDVPWDICLRRRFGFVRTAARPHAVEEGPRRRRRAYSRFRRRGWSWRRRKRRSKVRPRRPRRRRPHGGVEFRERKQVVARRIILALIEVLGAALLRRYIFIVPARDKTFLRRSATPSRSFVLRSGSRAKGGGLAKSGRAAAAPAKSDCTKPGSHAAARPVPKPLPEPSVRFSPQNGSGAAFERTRGWRGPCRGGRETDCLPMDMRAHHQAAGAGGRRREGAGIRLHQRGFFRRRRQNFSIAGRTGTVIFICARSSAIRRTAPRSRQAR